ncbi:unnamed protein product [Ectocarpus sp. 6 AP-2014]
MAPPKTVLAQAQQGRSPLAAHLCVGTLHPTIDAFSSWCSSAAHRKTRALLLPAEWRVFACMQPTTCGRAGVRLHVAPPKPSVFPPSRHSVWSLSLLRLHPANTKPSTVAHLSVTSWALREACCFCLALIAEKSSPEVLLPGSCI